MHGFTPISIAGATTSLIVSPALVFLLLRARRSGVFQTWPYVAFMLVESLFLVAYMTLLSFQEERLAEPVSAIDATLGGIHGAVSMLVFLGFWALLPILRRSFSTRRNVLATHPAVFRGAVALRALALLSGEAIFVTHVVV